MHLAIAIPAAWLLAQTVRSQLYGIQRFDPVSMSTATLAIAAVAALAGYLPARCATRVDLMCALRYEWKFAVIARSADAQL